MTYHRNNIQYSSTMDLTEWLRRLKRSLDNYFTYRRTFFLIFLICGLILYLAPYISRHFTVTKTEDFAESCLRDRLTAFTLDTEEFNSNLQHEPLRGGEKAYIPWVGNGVFGLETTKGKGVLHIRHGRTLSLPVSFAPLVAVVPHEEDYYQEASIVHYPTGIVHHIQCLSSGLVVAHQYYAHRTFPSMLVQSLEITNPNDDPVKVVTEQRGNLHWTSSDSHKMSLQNVNKKNLKFLVATGMIDIPDSSADQVLAVAVVMQIAFDSITMIPHSSINVELLTSINYSEPISRANYNTQRDVVERQAIESLREALRHHGKLRESHAAVWQQLWSTGFSISYSKAADSINGDKINATMYYVLSQVRSPLHEHIPSQQRAELEKILLYSEGCFGGYHTLQAQNLWPSFTSLAEINNAVSLWLLTLEKQGCHNLVKAGASGVVEAMVLSFGGLRFSNQHLEFNIHPKYLHRDFHFRRINYGNLTHVNISVTLQEDNKAVLFVSLDRSDKNYYACDAGCLDFPVQLGPVKKAFPVKLTDPVTAILYITSDKQHMEELRHTIHVKEIVEAPAHEHHVIALHKHGHHLGGLPTFFWLLISFLIVVFHLFLIKLIYNEYCGSQDKYRLRYSKH